MSIIIPIKPISTNVLFRGRKYKTREYNSFIEIGLHIAPKRKMIKGKVELEINFYLKTAKSSDLDNLLKGILDLIVKANFIQDDRLIYKLTAKKFKSNDERIELEIKPFSVN